MQHKTRLDLIFYIKLTLCGIMLFFLITGGLWAYYNVFEPAYVSVVDACNIRSPESMGYSNGANYYPDSGRIEIVFPDKYKLDTSIYDYDYSWQLKNEYKKTRQYSMFLKHEQIHKLQDESGRANFNCNQLIRFWIDECEAYFFMRF